MLGEAWHITKLRSRNLWATNITYFQSVLTTLFVSSQ